MEGNVSLCFSGINPFAKEATSPVIPSLAPSEWTDAFTTICDDRNTQITFYHVYSNINVIVAVNKGGRSNPFKVKIFWVRWEVK